jgi:hypothetical protein
LEANYRLLFRFVLKIEFESTNSLSVFYVTRTLEMTS